MGPERRFAGPKVAYNLLRIGENPSEEQIRAFEDISVTLRTSNGTFRTTFRNRFEDVDALFLAILPRHFRAETELRIEDRAVSHGLTSAEWGKRILPLFPRAEIEASDLVLQLIELSTAGGEKFITEADGTPLQYIKPPCVVSLYHRESMRNPIRCLVAAQARERFRRLALPEGWTEGSPGPGFQVSAIPYIHPEAAALALSDPRFRFRQRSVFEISPAACHVVRTMNIFNRDYFSDERLAEGFRAIFESLRPGGIWVAGRTLEEDLSNHASIFQRTENGWKILDRLGGGWGLESMAVELFR